MKINSANYSYYTEYGINYVVNAKALSRMRYQDDISIFLVQQEDSVQQEDARQWLSGKSAWLAMDNFKSGKAHSFNITISTINFSITYSNTMQWLTDCILSNDQINV